MPKYDYRCDKCGALFLDHYRSIHETSPFVCRHCLIPAPRYFGNQEIVISGGMPTHYNMALGQEVVGWRDMAEKAKRLSEEKTAELGYEVNLKPVDLRDKDKLGITDEGLDKTYNRTQSESLKKVIRNV